MNTARWRKVRRRVLKRAGWRCEKCGKPGGPFEVDHVRPMKRGGDAWDMANLQALCRRPCHADKTREENRGRPRTAGERAWRDLVAEFRGEAG